MAYDLKSLNSEQIIPVMDTEGAIMVTAGAGSGKTRLLTHRIAHLINDLGVFPYHILAITFTNKAAGEMRDRLSSMTDSGDGIWVFTFHALCVRILRKFIHKIGYDKNFVIYDDTESGNIVKRIAQSLNAEMDADDIKKIIGAVSYIKNGEADADSFHTALGDKLAECAQLYEAQMKKNNALDFDDLIIKAYFLLTEDDEARQYYQNKFRYIHVDEFQDTNALQYKLISLLAAQHRNIFIVGDEDQSIYGWRGANIENLNSFRRDFKCKEYKLERNYRSTKNILDYSNTIIKNNLERVDKTLWTENADGDKPEIYAALSDGYEADFVIGTIINLVRQGGYSYNDFAILMRVNALSRSFEERLRSYAVPYKIYGGFKFYERKEIKDLLAYMRIASNHSDTEAIRRVINFPKRGIGDGTVEQLFNYASVTDKDLYNILISVTDNPDLPKAVVKKAEPFGLVLRLLSEQTDKIGLSDLVIYLVRMLNLKEVYGEDTDENLTRKANINEFIESVRQFEKNNPDASLADYMQTVSLISDMDNAYEGESVTIATVHSAKGLEFRVVFAVGLEDGIFPSSRSVDHLPQFEEERRLMYVAITRAEEKLYLTFSRTRFMYGEKKLCTPSRFLGELGYHFKDEREEKSKDYSTRHSGDDDNYSSQNKKSYGAVFNASKQPEKRDIDTSCFTTGVRVRHKKFGEGRIVGVSENYGNEYAEIEFEKFGKMTLSLAYAPIELADL